MEKSAVHLVVLICTVFNVAFSSFAREGGPPATSAIISHLSKKMTKKCYVKDQNKPQAAFKHLANDRRSSIYHGRHGWTRKQEEEVDSERIFGILWRSKQPPAPSGEGRKKEREEKEKKKKKCPKGKMRAHKSGRGKETEGERQNEGVVASVWHYRADFKNSSPAPWPAARLPWRPNHRHY